jgi:hypothetical protein
MSIKIQILEPIYEKINYNEDINIDTYEEEDTGFIEKLVERFYQNPDLLNKLLENGIFNKYLKQKGYANIEKIKHINEKVLFTKEFYIYNKSRFFVKETDLANGIYDHSDVVLAASGKILQNIDIESFKNINIDFYNAVNKEINRLKKEESEKIKRKQESEKRRKQKDIAKAKELLKKEGITKITP